MSSRVAPVTFTSDRFQQGARQQEDFSGGGGGLRGEKKRTLRLLRAEFFPGKTYLRNNRLLNPSARTPGHQRLDR